MPNIKEIANRISSVTSTQQLTQAMNMVAAAKLSKVQQQVLHMRLYTDRLITILNHVTAGSHKPITQNYLDQRSIENLLIVVVTSDRGLCGAFNTNVLKKALNFVHKSARTAVPAQITIVPIGRHALTFFQRKTYTIIPDYVALSHHLNFENISPVVSWFTKIFLQHRYDQIVLVYNAFQSAAVQVPVVEQWLPVSDPTIISLDPERTIDYIYEPSRTDLVATLIPHVLQIQFYKALLESNAAEHGARMTTMSKATDNAEELLKSLKLTYNRTRQAVITQEIAEIVAGA